jgi:hypothetical protein
MAKLFLSARITRNSLRIALRMNKKWKKRARNIKFFQPKFIEENTLVRFSEDKRNAISL